MKTTTKFTLLTCVATAALTLALQSGFAQTDAPASDASAATSPAPRSHGSVSEKILNQLRTFLSPMRKVPSSQQERAIELARQGKYDEALQILDKLHQRDKGDLQVTRDYATVLGWAGHDQQAVDLYENLPEKQPGYVLAAMGHSYRKLGETDKATEVYRIALKEYPDNVYFEEGVIRCMVDKGQLEDALAKANEDIANPTHGERKPIMDVKGDILNLIFKRDEQKAVELARQSAFPEAVSRFHDLYAQHSDDANLTRDYLATLDWQGGNDEQVVSLYKTLPAGEQPDYVLSAVGHAYRNLKQYDQAQAVYEEGYKRYPDNVLFAEGTIRALADQKKYDQALALADADLKAHGERPEIVDIKKNVIKLKPAPKKKHKAGKRSHR